ncbi:hypothetical protein DNF23_17265 [Pseudomonas syringae pv. pisi]|nr:hypothetical protein DND47_26835 [Pseudomonas syringae pv. syringae]
MNCWRTCASLSGSNREDAERPERHANAEHWHDSVLTDAYRSSRSSVGMHFRTLRVQSRLTMRRRV